MVKLLGLVAAVALVAGCGKSNPLVGTWEAECAKTGTGSTRVSATFTETTVTRETAEFRAADCTGVKNVTNRTTESYKVEGNEIVTTSTSTKDNVTSETVVSKPFKVDGDKLKLLSTNAEEKVEATLTRKK